MEDPALKTLLAAGKALLKPPDPLPSAPQLLLERLRESSALLPWSDRAGWTEDDELDEIGDDDADDRGKRKARRDQLVLLVGQRCLDLVVAIQAFLGKEFWPAEYRQGLKETDCKSCGSGTDVQFSWERLICVYCVSCFSTPSCRTCCHSRWRT